MNTTKLTDAGFVKLAPNWYVKMYKRGDMQHGVAVLMTSDGPAVLRAAESVELQKPAVIAGCIGDVEQLGERLAVSGALDYGDDLSADDDLEWDDDDEDDDDLDDDLDEDDDDLEWDDDDDDELDEDELDDDLEWSAEVGAGRGRRRRRRRRAKRGVRRGARKAKRAVRRTRSSRPGVSRRQRRKARVQTRREGSKFRKKLHKAASRLARGKVLKRLRNAKVKILQSPLADAATGMAAEALKAYGVPPAVTKMALNTAMEAGIDRGKKGGWAGMAMRATAPGAKRGTAAREAAKRQLQALKGGAKRSFPGGFGDVVKSFAASANLPGGGGGSIGPSQLDALGVTSRVPTRPGAVKRANRANAVLATRAASRGRRGGM